MGWQKRAAGKQYNNPSGHAFMVGGYTNKILCHICYAKGCATCHKRWKKGVSINDAMKDRALGDLAILKQTTAVP